MTVTQEFSIRGYDLHERLGSGSMGAVYRATQRLTGESVALKRILHVGGKADGSSAGVENQVALMTEFQTTASLHHPNIVRVLDYGLDTTKQPYIVMELLSKPRNIAEANESTTFENKVRCISQLLQALVYLHRRGVVHRDIKPSNVLMHENAVKLLDFGVATQQAGNAHLVGTLLYMAPELLQGAPAAPSSDLYAVGVLAYEVLFGRLPFNLASVRAILSDVTARSVGYRPEPKAPGDMPLTHQTLATVPGSDDEWSRTRSLELLSQEPVMPAEGPLAPLVERLLNRNVGQRYHDAREVLKDLARLSGVSLQQDSAARDSFLQAARMVGRDREMGALTQALHTMLTGHGSGWLVGGESGVGKSRLLEEVRTQALVRSAQVVRGQAVSEGGSPFLVWRTALRQLCVQSNLSDDEASVLLDLVPDIAALLDRPVVPAPAVEAQAALLRLYSCVESVLRRSQALLVILEDVQWAGPESIELLRYLGERLGDMPVLLVATYRNDEKPELPRDLPKLRNLKLERLGADAAAALCETMLGPAGRRRDIVDFLLREAEGNVFFMIEVTRALSESVQDLNDLPLGALPAHIVTGGIRTLLQRRLRSVSSGDWDLLKVAAVAGRDLDTRLLEHLSMGQNVGQWLLQCANAAVLDWHEQRWRFAHDKLREAVLAALTPEEAAQLHLRVAEGIELLYPNDLDRYAAALALHCERASLFEKAAAYHVRAGSLAERGHAAMVARASYLEALAMLERVADSPARRRRKAEAAALYAHMAWSADPPEEVMARLQGAEKDLSATLAVEGVTPEDRRLLGRLHLWMGRVTHGAGQSSQAIVYYKVAMAIGQELNDENLMALPSLTIGQARVVQGYLREWPMIAKGLPYVRANSSFIDIVRATGYVGFGMCGDGQLQRADAACREAYKLAHEAKNQRGVAFASIYYSWMRLIADDWVTARRLAQEVIDGAQASGDRILEFIGHGQWAWAEVRSAGNLALAAAAMGRANALREALGGKVLIGDWIRAAECEVVLAQEGPAAALPLAMQLVEASRAADLPLSCGIAERLCGIALASQNQWAAAEALFASSVTHLIGAGVHLEADRTHLQWAEWAERRGDNAEAERLRTLYAAHHDRVDFKLEPL